MPNDVRYHKSTENIEDGEENGAGKPTLNVTYRRFTVLERVLIVAVCVFVILTIVFGVLYARGGASKQGKKNQNGELEEKPKHSKERNNSSCMPKTPTSESEQLKALMQSLDWSVDPCDDFYHFTCNRWMATHDIDQANSGNSVDQFRLLQQKNNKLLIRKLQDRNTIKKYNHLKVIKKAQDDFSACMSYAEASEEEKFRSLNRLIERYGGWNISGRGWSSKDWKLMPNLLKIHRELGIFPLFFFGIGVDIKNSTRNQIFIKQWATFLLWLPKFFYHNDPISTKERNIYRKKMLGVMAVMANKSENDTDVKRQADDVFEFEKKLSEISVSPGRTVNQEKYYNLLKVKELQDETGNNFQWLDYLKGMFRDTNITITMDTMVNVNQPNYIKNMTEIVANTDDLVLANHFIWYVIGIGYRTSGLQLPEKLATWLSVGRSFKSKSQREKRCFSFVRAMFGLPLSVLYVDEKFREEHKKNFTKMVDKIQKAFIKDVEESSWLDDETRKNALRKIKATKVTIGYPDLISDHDKLNKWGKEIVVKKDDYVSNWIGKQTYAMEKKLRSFSRPVDKSKESTDPLDSNPKYSPTRNRVFIPAGILQSPFYEISRPMSLNYGGIGMIVGHELMHSLDPNGQRYDEDGNLRNWWTNSSSMEFERRAKCIEKHYSNISFKGFKIDGAKSVAENMADNGGIKPAFQAYQEWRSENIEPEPSALKLNNEQLFFVGSSQIWCSKYRRIGDTADGKHSPGMARVIGTLSNMPEFAKAFDCPVGSRMNPKKKCSIW